jgi:hypothetical protein
MVEHHLLSTLLEDFFLNGIFDHELEDENLRKRRRYVSGSRANKEARRDAPSFSDRIGRLERWPGDLDGAEGGKKGAEVSAELGKGKATLISSR